MLRGEPLALAAIQEWIWRLVTESSGVGAALVAEGDVRGAELAALVAGDRTRPPQERLAVYGHAYFARIHDCLCEDFPALARALGPAAFHDLVKTYLMIHPPTRPSLRHAGAQLSRHLASEPFGEIFGRRCPYARDLARLEWAMTKVFDAADAPILARAALAALAAESWCGLRFETIPALQILACAWPVHVVRERYDGEDPEAAWNEAPPLAAEPTCLRVWRRGEEVRYRAISSLELVALGAARRRESFGAICERMASWVGAEEAALGAASFLASWLADGLLARVL